MTSILSVRVSTQERDLLEAAANQSKTSLSDFVRRKALEAAEIDCLQRTTIVIPAKQWSAFEAWASRPPEKREALEKLAKRRPAWER